MCLCGKGKIIFEKIYSCLQSEIYISAQESKTLELNQLPCLYYHDECTNTTKPSFDFSYFLIAFLNKLEPKSSKKGE